MLNQDIFVLRNHYYHLKFRSEKNVEIQRVFLSNYLEFPYDKISKGENRVGERSLFWPSLHGRSIKGQSCASSASG